MYEDWELPDELPSEDADSIREQGLDEKAVTVVGVFEHAAPNADEGLIQRFVLLQDREERKVPIWIGPFEAFAIHTAIEGQVLDRPMTHDLIRLLINRLGAHVDQVIVDDLWQETYYAKLHLTRADESFEIDCRPSDAIAIAVRTGAPIFVAERVFETVTPPDLT